MHEIKNANSDMISHICKAITKMTHVQDTCLFFVFEKSNPAIVSLFLKKIDFRYLAEEGHTKPDRLLKITSEFL